VKVTRSLHDALEETLGFIQRALDRIQAGEAVEAELHNVRAYLHEAFLRFGDRLRSARPSELARGIGLLPVAACALNEVCRALASVCPAAGPRV